MEDMRMRTHGGNICGRERGTDCMTCSANETERKTARFEKQIEKLRAKINHHVSEIHKIESEIHDIENKIVSL